MRFYCSFAYKGEGVVRTMCMTPSMVGMWRLPILILSAMTSSTLTVVWVPAINLPQNCQSSWFWMTKTSKWITIQRKSVFTSGTQQQMSSNSDLLDVGGCQHQLCQRPGRIPIVSTCHRGECYKRRHFQRNWRHRAATFFCWEKRRVNRTSACRRSFSSIC